jgi:hypothetical protein
MNPKYTEIDTPSGGKCIVAEYDNSIIHLIPPDPANSDYQRYLAWLENPEAEQSTPNLSPTE